MSIQAQALDDEPVEVARQEVGEEERGGLVLDDPGELRARRVELIAVGAGQALDPFLRDDRVEQAAGAAVGVGHEHAVIPGATATDALADGGRDAAGPVVEGGRQAGDVDVREVARQCDELVGERPAADHEDPRGVAVRPGRWHVNAHVARR